MVEKEIHLMGFRDLTEYLRENVRMECSILYDKYAFKDVPVCVIYHHFVYIENKYIGLRFDTLSGYQEHEDKMFLRIYAYLPPWKEEGLKLTHLSFILFSKFIDSKVLKEYFCLLDKKYYKRIGLEKNEEEIFEKIKEELSSFYDSIPELKEINELIGNYSISNKERIRISLVKYSEFLDKYLSDVLRGENREWIDVVPWRDEREIW
ncbi:MAG: hypothetical protein KatS3mg031_3077 [Chitinophagales bacterium]|nr:MAG: hypothetical protein KatS3mg031_3077 [Chitinophagales bacterium]